jgi:hypothetical protein
MRIDIKTTADGRRVEVIGRYVCLDGKQESDTLIAVAEHPNRAAILAAVPNATHMAGRLPLTAEETKKAAEAMLAARRAYEQSPQGVEERVRRMQRVALERRAED